MARWQAYLAPTVEDLGLGMRPEDPDLDASFLDRLYATTRVEELAKTGWTESQVRQFLYQQSRQQRAHYREHYPAAEYLVFLDGGEPVGRLYLDARVDELRLMDIAFLPAWRGGGRGTVVIEALQRRAQQERLAITLHVEPFNPAARLYRRLGFGRVETRGVYEFLRWAPPGGPGIS